MAFFLHQRIAGVDFLVSVPPGVMVQAPSAIQVEFACRHPAGGDAIRVRLVRGDLPDMSSWRTLVSYGPTWSIRQRGGGRALCLGAPAAFPSAGLVACWQEDASQATVYCGPEYLTRSINGVEMVHAAGYPVDQLLLMYYLASRQGLIVHAAGLAMGGRGLVFPGVSGAGKSTLIRQFLARGWPTLLSDDRVILRRIGDVYQAYGTPWPGDAGVAVNAGAALAGLLFLVKGEENRAVALRPQQAIERLFPAASIPWYDPGTLAPVLETCEDLVRSVPAFELRWWPGTAVVDFLQDFVRRL